MPGPTPTDLLARRVRRFAGALALGGVMYAVPAAADSPARDVEVRTASGRVAGAERDGVLSFEGVPYAAPPVGRLRWRAPQPPVPWTGVRRAADFCASCSQSSPPRHVLPSSRGATTSEDCLALNVWVRPGARRDPVIVWIHGGGNQDGTSAQTYYDGSAFARDSVVFVSFNYRLGLLGFFAHPGLEHERERGAGPGANFGLLDQVAALRWVQANIAAFGGDPGNVTVMGESSGGEDIVALLTAPPARGLFRRAIIESAGGGWGPPPTLAQAERSGLAAAAAAGMAGAPLDSLRALPADAIVRAGEGRDAGPVVDGVLLPEPPLEALRAGRVAHVPVLIGTNDGEGSVLSDGAAPDSLFPRLDPARLSRLREGYGAGAGTDDAFARRLFRDGYFVGPARFVARRMAEHSPVYLYRFDYVARALRRRRESANHGSEIPFVFETLDRTIAQPEDLQVARDVHECWVSFARTGVPRASRLAAWPALGDGPERMAVFGAEPSVQPLDLPENFGLLEQALAPAGVRGAR